MRVLIDRERMVFCYAHESVDVLLDLAHLEVDAPCVVVPLEHPTYFNTFTDYELKLLYQNTTGHKYNGFNRAALMQVVCDLALRHPVWDGVTLELRAQANSVDEEDAGVYRYVRGSHKPKLVQDGVFGPVLHKVPRSEAEEATAARGELRKWQAPAEGWVSAGTGDDRKQGGTTARAHPRPAGIAPPPRGSTRETIWGEADRMWEEAGKPTELSTVLALRKRIMDSLEAMGVKRTSSSNELGNWQKVRLL